jgi:hypothetical protein
VRAESEDAVVALILSLRNLQDGPAARLGRIFRVLPQALLRTD